MPALPAQCQHRQRKRTGVCGGEQWRGRARRLSPADTRPLTRAHAPPPARPPTPPPSPPDAASCSTMHHLNAPASCVPGAGTAHSAAACANRVRPPRAPSAWPHHPTNPPPCMPKAQRGATRRGRKHAPVNPTFGIVCAPYRCTPASARFSPAPTLRAPRSQHASPEPRRHAVRASAHAPWPPP
jgi:hypothetical protein